MDRMKNTKTVSRGGAEARSDENNNTSQRMKAALPYSFTDYVFLSLFVFFRVFRGRNGFFRVLRGKK